MARCPARLLEDVADVLAVVRGWPGVTERSPAVFYWRRQPFLHFHLVEGGRRRADVKAPSGWVQIDVPHPLSSAGRRAFLRALRRRYTERSNSLQLGAPTRPPTPPALGASRRRRGPR
jgi:hypothetical protein